MALVIALLGAECSGKSTLAQTLAESIPALSGLRTAWVPEALRAWCEAQGRTPHADEQAAIAEEQAQAIEAATRQHEVVLADTTPLQTACYSSLIFADDGPRETALAWQREHVALTLLCMADLPWQADGLQRDGTHIQAPVEAWLREALQRNGLAHSPISGSGQARIEMALAACAPLLLRAMREPAARSESALADAAQKRRRPGGLFTAWRAAAGGADAATATRPAWLCPCCDDPSSERALKRAGALSSR